MRRFTLAILFTCGLAPSAFSLSTKNFREILQFFGNATGVDPQLATVQQVYLSVRTRLPLRGQVSELTSPAVLGATELAGVFCTQMITNDSVQPTANRRAHQAIDFTKLPAAQTDAALNTTVSTYAQLFWERAPTVSEIETFKASWTNLKTISPATTEGTKQVFRVLCTQAATSMSSLIYN